MRLKDYLPRAKNGTKEGSEEIKKIEIAEVLAVGLYMYGEPEVAIVRSTENEIWIINEGGALVSRHDVKPGMKLTLKLKRMSLWKTEVSAIK